MSLLASQREAADCWNAGAFLGFASAPGGRVVPQNEGGLEWDECSGVLGNQARSEVGCGAGGWKRRGVHETVFRADQTFASLHGLAQNGGAIFLFGVELGTNGVGIQLVEKDLNLKEVLSIFLFEGCGAESDHRPVLG